MTFWRIFSYLNQPRTQLTSIFEDQPSKIRPFSIKTRVMWVLGMDSFQYSRPPQKNQPNDLPRTSPNSPKLPELHTALGLAGVFTMATWHHRWKLRTCPTRGTQWMMIFFRWNKKGWSGWSCFPSRGLVESTPHSPRFRSFGKESYQLNPGEKKRATSLTSLLFLRIIMEVENGSIRKVSTIGGNHFSLPWLWEEG